MGFERYDADRYLDFDEIEAWCHALSKAHPEWVALHAIGESRRGQAIWMLELGSPEAREAEAPAIWLDAGTHASEWTGVSAALYSVSAWLDGLVGGDAELLAWFSTHRALVVPVISPDGYDAMRKGSAYLRSSLRPPPEGVARAGLVPSDVDGDGQVRMMRWRHPAGALVEDEATPGYMRPRTLDDDPADAFFVCPEGEFVHWDGLSWVRAPLEHGVDLNRNFPGNWAPFSMFGMDAGRYSLSEPEARAVTDAFAENPSICAALTLHTYTGCVLTQPYRKDSPLPKGDLELMGALARDLVAGTGYKVYKVYPEFMYDLKQEVVGVWADTMATVFGVPGFTVEFWDPFGHADVANDDPAGFFMNPDHDKIRAMVGKFCEEPGAFDGWRAFDHPQLGAVELGGIDYLHTIRNPPVALLAGECARGHAMAERLRRALPEVRVRVTTSRLGEAATMITADFENVGFLATCGLRRAAALNACPGCSVGVELGAGVTLVDGEELSAVEHLSGWGELRTSAAKHPVYADLGARAHRARRRWIVEGEGHVWVRWTMGRSGAGEREIVLGGER